MHRLLRSNIHSHWNLLIGDLQASPREFYQAVEEEVTNRQVPDVRFSRNMWYEAGVTSSQREYLRVARGALHFDICAAPFGTGFFYSWWLIGPNYFGVRYLLTVLAIIGMEVYAIWKFVGTELGVPLGLVVIPATLLLLADAVRKGRLGNEGSVLAMPLFGRLYERLFSPNTYYKLDTESMFQAAVHQSVQEAINRTTEAKGIRPPTEQERKPVFELLAAATT